MEQNLNFSREHKLTHYMTLILFKKYRAQQFYSVETQISVTMYNLQPESDIFQILCSKDFPMLKQIVLSHSAWLSNDFYNYLCNTRNRLEMLCLDDNIGQRQEWLVCIFFRICAQINIFLNPCAKIHFYAHLWSCDAYI